MFEVDQFYYYYYYHYSCNILFLFSWRFVILVLLACSRLPSVLVLPSFSFTNIISICE